MMKIAQTCLVGLAMLALGMVASFLTSNLTIGFILGAVFNAPLVATMYAEGLGTEKDFPAAFEWFKKSAEAGNPAAQFMIASFYLNGHAELPDVKPDIVKSYAWYRITARQDRLPDMAAAGKELARRLTAQLSPDQILQGEAIADEFYKTDQEPSE